MCDLGAISYIPGNINTAKPSLGIPHAIAAAAASAAAAQVYVRFKI